MVQFTDNAIQSLFGNEAAENESIARLRQYYVKSDPFEMMTGEAPLRILVGHKGIGKSALVKVALAEAAERGEVAILVRPDDIHGVAAKDADIPELIREWKDGLTTIIAKKVVECIGGSSGKAEITAGAAQVMEVIASSISLKSFKMSLDPARKAIAHRFLKSQRVVVYLDDLDRGWEGRRADLKRISALLNAARDMSSDSPGLMFRIALRTDVYYLVRTSDESTDKVEGSVVWYSWTNHEIMLLLIKRIETFFGRNVNETALRKEKQRHIARYLDNVFSRRFEGQGHWANAPTYKVLMSLVRKRPRDLALGQRPPFAFQRPLEPFQHAAFANVFDSLGAARNRVGNLLVGPPRSVRIGLQENLSAAHLLAAAVEFADRLLTDLAFLGGESNDVLFLRHESCLGSRSASR